MRPMISEIDHIRISAVVSELSDGISPRKGPGVGNLRRRLNDLVVVEPTEIGADRVTMNSRVLFRYAEDNEERVIRLVYPSNMPRSYDPEAVSILSPLGSALLGSRKGDTVVWNAPAGEMRGEIIDVLYQPEAAGDPD